MINEQSHDETMTEFLFFSRFSEFFLKKKVKILKEVIMT